jgi:5'-nucleotidase
VNILITNDDGIDAPGLWALAEELSGAARVLVVAPDREQTGVGTSITLHQPLRVKEFKSPIPDIESYSIEGTPADSVIVGMRMLWQNKVDMVVSGINEGPNLGKDVLVSGTVGAALQAQNCGLPALALSIAAVGNIHFEAAARLADCICRQVGSGKLSKSTLLNINLPNLPLAELEGIDITRLGSSGYTQDFAVNRVAGHYDAQRINCWITPCAIDLKEEQGTDILAVRRNRISITPIHNRLTSHEEPRSLPGVCNWLSEQLSSGSLAVTDHLVK